MVHTIAMFGVLLWAAASAVAATPGEFYLSILRRGVAAFDAEKYAEASEHLKIAAFGFVDSIEYYETAQVYLALSHDRLENIEKARDAARRVVAAERIERKFVALKLPAGVASSFDAVARKLLTSSETALLGRVPHPPIAPPVTADAQKLPAHSTQPPPAEPQRTSAGTNNIGTAEQEKKPPAQKPPEKPAEKPAVVKAAEKQSVEKPPAEKPLEKSPVEKPAVEKPVEKAPIEIDVQTSPVSPEPKPQQPAPRKTTTAQDHASRLAAGERSLIASQLPEARRIYRGLLETPGVARETLIRVAEGLYRSRDFEGALAAFAKIGSLRRGEEPYQYYIAVSHYESGQYGEAKDALAAALPHIEITPDVARYRAKIEGAIRQ